MTAGTEQVQHTPWRVAGMTNQEEWSVRGADNHLIGRFESEEIARLIAAAPELLAALERCEQEERGEGREWFWIAAIVRKARGEE